jgi:hypothetical protein
VLSPTEELILTIDGQEHERLVPGQRVVARRAEQPVRLVRFPAGPSSRPSAASSSGATWWSGRGRKGFIPFSAATGKRHVSVCFLDPCLRFSHPT